MSTKNAIHIIRTINAPLEVVFSTLTDQQKLSAYTGECVLEPFPGGKIEMFDGWAKGEIIEFEDNKRLTYTWQPSDWDNEHAASLVIFTFSPKDEFQTEVHVDHSNFPDEEQAQSHKEGWEEYIFSPLEEYLKIK